MGILNKIWGIIVRNRKKLVYGVLAFLCCQILLFNFGGIGIQNQVFADNNNSESFSDELAIKWRDTVGALEKVVYVVLWPCLFLAGKLVDNSFVYGSVFGFDAILWKLWNIVKNVANFGLGFIFVYSVGKILISKKNDGIKDLLIHSLIAGVGIQASWFIMAALIDISTIAAYGIGGLPISVLGSEGSGGYNPYIIGTSVYMDSNDSDTIRMYLVNGSGSDGLYISECETFTYSEGTGKNSEELIIAPKMIYYLDGKIAYPTRMDMCNYYGRVYYMSPLTVTKYSQHAGFSGTGRKESQGNYLKKLTEDVTYYNSQSKDDIEIYIGDGDLLQIGDAHMTGGINGPIFKGITYGKSDKVGWDVNNEWVGSESGLRRLSDMLTDSANEGTYLGVFSTLYSSLMNAGTNMKIGNRSEATIGVREGLLNTFLSFAHMIGIGIPLIVLTLVLAIRIFVLWMAIALSPAIILLTAFGFDKKIFKEGFMSNLQVKNLLGVIFSPALVCFAVSMSTVLVKIITDFNLDSIHTDTTSLFGGLIRLNIAGVGVSLGKLIVSAIAVVITWVLMWWAIQANSIGNFKWVGELKKTVSNALGSIPVVPVISKDKSGNLKTTFVGKNVALGTDGQGGILSKMSQKAMDEYGTESNEAINAILNSESSGEAIKKQNDAYVAKLSGLSSFDKWYEKPIMVGERDGHQESLTFNSLDADRQQYIIDQINSLSEDKLNKIGNSASDLGGYKFDSTQKQYVKNS